MSADAPAETAPRPAEGEEDGRAEADAAASPTPDDAAAHPARRKRKRKRPEIANDEIANDEAPARRDGVPAFTLDFPDDPALAALVAAFEQGDYARVRREAPALVQQTESVAVRKAARELRKRLEPDPIAVYLLSGAALLLAFLSFWYWTHPHGAP